jgi:hypothetical protein
MGCLKFMKICSPRFLKWLDVVYFHFTRIERLFADGANTFRGSP